MANASIIKDNLLIIHSNARIKTDQTQSLNPTNPVKIELSGHAIPTTRVASIEVVSSTVPFVEQTVDLTSNSFYYSQSIPLAPFGKITSVISVSNPPYVYSATVPTNFNPVNTLDGILFTSSQPHFLDEIPLWKWGDPIRLMGSFEPILLTSSTVVILSPTTFNILGYSTPMVGEIGFIYFPPFPSPHAMAVAFNTLLNQSFYDETKMSTLPAPFKVSFTGSSAFFSVKITDLAIRTPALAFLKTCVLDGDPGVNLMGFGANSKPFATQLVPYTIVAPDIWLGQMNVTLRPGNYDAETLRTESMFQFNRWHYPFNLVDTVTFGLIDSSVLTLSIKKGLYHPDSLEQVINESLVLGSQPLTCTIAFTGDGVNTTVTFSSNDIFSMQFDPTDNFNERLGFINESYSGFSSYSSDFPFSTPTYPSVAGNFRVYQNGRIVITDRPVRRLLSFSVQQAPVITQAIYYLNDTEFRWLLYTPLEANGLQVGDITEISFDLGGTRLTYQLNVFALTDAFNCTLQLGSGNIYPTTNADFTVATSWIDTAFNVHVYDVTIHPFYVGNVIVLQYHTTDHPQTVTLTGVCNAVTATSFDVTIDQSPNPYVGWTLFGANINVEVHVVTPPYFNVLFAKSAARTTQVNPEIYGFGAYDYQWLSGNVISPFPYYFLPIPFLLVELRPPQGGSNLSQNYDGQNTLINQLVQLRPGGEILNYSWPKTQLIFFGGTSIDYLTFSIYRPDQKLYQLHGLEWSLTLNIKYVDPLDNQKREAVQQIISKNITKRQ